MDETFAVHPRDGQLRAAQPRLITDAMGTKGPAVQAPLFDFKSVMRLFRRRTGLILFVILLCVGLTVFLHSLAPNAYSASTRILLDEQSVNPFDGDEVFAEIGLSNPAVESQMIVMRSPFILEQVVERLDLSNDVAFMAAPTTPMRDKIAELRASFFPSSIDTYQKTASERFQHAVETLRSNLTVSRNARTLVIQLKYTSSSRQLASEVVNAVADTYLDSRLGVRQETAARAAAWFDDRIAELNVSAIDVEQKIQRLSTGRAEALDQSQSLAALQSPRDDLQQAMATRAQLQSELAELRALIANGRGLDAIPPRLNTGAMATLVQEASALRAELAAVMDSAPDNSAEIERLTTQIDAVEDAGTTLLGSLLSNAQEQFDEAQNAELAARAAFAAARDVGGSGAANAIEVELRSLEGEARVYRDLRESYLESYLRTIQQQSFPSTEATIIETAIEPDSPDGPGLARLLVLAAMVGLTLGASAAFMVEVSDGRLRTGGQLARAAQAPFLGALPDAADDVARSGFRAGKSKLPAIHVVSRTRDSQQEVIALPGNRVSQRNTAPQMYAAIVNPLSSFSETIRRVNVEADNLQSMIEHKGGPTTKVIGFVSDQESRGRSIAAVNYAEMLAVGGGLTVLIDLDWTGLFLTESIAPAAQLGLAELSMANSASRSEQAFWYDERTSLYFLPNRSMAKDTMLDPRAFDQTRLKVLISTLSMKFENIVLDLSPMAVSSDPAAVAEVVSGFVAVADWGQTRSASLTAELQRAGIYHPKLIGTVMNGVSKKKLANYEAAT